jgi:hypothetical protein
LRTPPPEEPRDEDPELREALPRETLARDELPRETVPRERADELLVRDPLDLTEEPREPLVDGLVIEDLP